MPTRHLPNLDSLQMMVQSGVVRRADSSPPDVSLTQFQVMENIDQNHSKDMAVEQRWLSRIVLGRRSQSLFVKRPKI
ncbi:MAG: hypothetical protein CV089_04460 [Nitrospira sp. WS110]|nr:hypothetical protein [Nitrospira sp. WS110]